MYLSEYLITRDKTNLRLEVLDIFYYLKNKSNQNIEIYLENNCKSVYLKIFLTYILCKKSDTEAETKTLLDNLKTKYEHVPEYQSFKINLKKIDILLSMKIFTADKLNKISFDEIIVSICVSEGVLYKIMVRKRIVSELILPSDL